MEGTCRFCGTDWVLQKKQHKLQQGFSFLSPQSGFLSRTTRERKNENKKGLTRDNVGEAENESLVATTDVHTGIDFHSL
jgi:hypothetical protein